jgi:hypothetical protein
MELLWNDTDTGKPTNSEKNLSQWLVVRASAVKNWRPPFELRWDLGTVSIMRK